MNVVPDKIFKSYDIRGIYPQELYEENIVHIIRAIYKFFQNKKNTDNQLSVVLGRDMRLSSPGLFKKALETLVEIGAKVIDIGLVSTPTLYFAVFNYDFDCGIQISASHNPKEYNGIKIVGKEKNGLLKVGKSTGMDDIKKMSLRSVKFNNPAKGSVVKMTGILEDEIKNALNIAGNPKIKKLKIVADAANAMGGQYIDALFKKVPADLIRMNFELDGNFPVHQPDPLKFETLADLQKMIVSEKADLGLAPDGDGDRLFFVDEKGKIVPASTITAIVAKDLLKRFRGATVLFDIRYTLTAEKIVRENGGIPHVTKVGHAFITEAMAKTGAIFAGETSGHYFYKDTGNAESQLTTILIILKIMSQQNQTLSELVEDVKRSFESGEINFKVENSSLLLERIKEKYKGGKTSTFDGVSIAFPNWKFSLRSSNTEPLVRLNVESYNQDTMEEKKTELVDFVNKFVFASQVFDKSKFLVSSFVKKIDFPWGYELVFVPKNKPFTGKVLHVKAGKRLSLQAHDQKEESWLLINGEAKAVLENASGKLCEINLRQGEGYNCSVGQKHRLIGITDCDIIEVSTPEVGTTYHLEDDYERGGSGQA